VDDRRTVAQPDDVASDHRAPSHLLERQTVGPDLERVFRPDASGFPVDDHESVTVGRRHEVGCPRVTMPVRVEDVLGSERRDA